MSMPSQEHVTQLLVDWGNGDKAALAHLTPLVYGELQRLARRYLYQERAGHTLESAALVNEAYLKLVDIENIRWQNRAHFFAVAAQLMRNILVDHARKRRYTKRGGGQYLLSISKAEALAGEPDPDLVALDDALTTLAALDQQQCRVVELRFFGGLTIEETAEVLGVSHATVERDWKVARAWLRRELSR